MKTHLSIRQKIALFSLSVFILLFTTVNARQKQTSAESNMATKFGIKGGLNLTNLHSNDFADNNLKAGINLRAGCRVNSSISIAESF
jgi:hypothetical protein